MRRKISSGKVSSPQSETSSVVVDSTSSSPERTRSRIFPHFSFMVATLSQRCSSLLRRRSSPSASDRSFGRIFGRRNPIAHDDDAVVVDLDGVRRGDVAQLLLERRRVREVVGQHADAAAFLIVASRAAQGAHGAETRRHARGRLVVARHRLDPPEHAVDVALVVKSTRMFSAAQAYRRAIAEPQRGASVREGWEHLVAGRLGPFVGAYVMYLGFE